MSRLKVTYEILPAVGDDQKYLVEYEGNIVNITIEAGSERTLESVVSEILQKDARELKLVRK